MIGTIGTGSGTTLIFGFEAEYKDSLRYIPMAVRFKLDTCGRKLTLDQWTRLSHEERLGLLGLPCSTESEIGVYRERLDRLVAERTGVAPAMLPVETDPPWMDPATVPPVVLQKALEAGVAMSPEQWAGLTPLQRFALIKLARSRDSSRNFLPALAELLGGTGSS